MMNKDFSKKIPDNWVEKVKPTKELYFSIDIEADGPIPGPNSMLSFGVVVFTIIQHKIAVLGTLESNLELLPNASQHPGTMAFWKRNQKAYDITRENLKDPKEAMEELDGWVRDFCNITKGKPVMVEYPGVYDFMWIYWYSQFFLDRCVFGFTGLSMKSYANALLKQDCLYKSNKRNFPRKWFDSKRHTHIALDDAMEQANLFVNMRKDNLLGTES